MKMNNVPDKAHETGVLKALPGLPVLPPRNALVELVVFFTIIMALEFGLNSLPDLNELDPHPFWLPVLLLSLQYGTVSGLLAAGVSILFTAFMGWPEQDIGENHFNYLIRIWAEPVLWIVAALILGQFRMRQISERRELHRRIQELNAQRTAIAAYSGNLRERCESLERSIAGRSEPAGNAILNAFAQMGNETPAHFTSGFGNTIETLLGPGQYSVFALRDDALSLVISHGWARDARWREVLNKDDPLVLRLVGEARGLSVFNADEEKLLDGQGYAAVPVLSRNEKRVLGILKVEEMGADRFGPDILSHLKVIAGQLASVLELFGGDGLEQGGEGQGIMPVAPARLLDLTRKESGSSPKNIEDIRKTTLKKPKVVS